MNISLVVSVDVPADTVAERLVDSFDQPLSAMKGLPTVGSWTVFGEVRGDEIRAETGGAFAGWRGWSGYGFWQPTFRGHVRSTPQGSLVEGTIRFRYSAFAVVLFVAVLAIGFVPPLLVAAVEAIAGGDYGHAAPPIAIILAVFVLPAGWVAHDLRNGRRESYALRDRIVLAVTSGPRSHGIGAVR